MNVFTNSNSITYTNKYQ